MKKLLFGLTMLIASLPLFGKSTDWSKVGLYSTNKCNVFNFELSGIDTTCMSYRYVEITNSSSQVLIRKTNGSRTFSLTFPSKGKYYATVLIMNKCNGDDTLWVDTINVDCMPSNNKCNWSGFWMKKTYQSQNYFNFTTDLGDDTCIDYMWLVYDLQLKRWDTLYDTRGTVQVQFNAKGKYKIGIKAYNKCTKCDTNFYQYIDITIYGNKAKLSYAPSIKDCKAYTFEMANIDNCMNYYYEIWNANEYTKNMTDDEWKKESDSLIYFTFDWNAKNLLYYSDTSERILKHTFADSGRYLIYTYWQNKCTGIDTWAFHKIIVCPKSQSTLSNKAITQPIPKIVGYYNLLGQPVEYMEPNKIYIILYDNNKRQKVMQVK